MSKHVNFDQKKLAGAGKKTLTFLLFLRGVLGKVVRRTWLFDGKNVVKCVVNVDRKQQVFAT
jgi:hypothetical protein